MIQTIIQALFNITNKTIFNPHSTYSKTNLRFKVYSKRLETFLFNMYDLMYNCMAYYLNFLLLSNFYLD